MEFNPIRRRHQGTGLGGSARLARSDWESTVHGAVELIDSDITTLTASADKVIRVPGPEPYLVNIELHSYHDSGLVRTLWYRQVALDYRHDLPVLTVIVLLCKEANSPHLTGTYERNAPDGFQTNCYNYRVVRLWQDDPELYLNSGVALVPLAPLADVSSDGPAGRDPAHEGEDRTSSPTTAPPSS